MSEKNHFILTREALLVPFLGLLAYFFAFSFRSGFLSHFGFEGLFVEIDLKSGMLALSGVIAAIVSVWIVGSVVPVIIVRVLINLVYLFLPIIFSGFIAILLFKGAGFTWAFFLAVFLSIFFIISIGYPIVRALWAGSKLDDLALEEAEHELRIRTYFVLDRALNKISDTIVLALVALLLAWPSGFLMGMHTARSERSFNVVELDSLFVIVAPYQNGFLASEFDANAESNSEAQLTGRNRLISLTELENISITHDQSLRLARASHEARGLNQPKGDWTTFDEFIDQFRTMP